MAATVRASQLGSPPTHVLTVRCSDNPEEMALPPSMTVSPVGGAVGGALGRAMGESGGQQDGHSLCKRAAIGGVIQGGSSIGRWPMGDSVAVSDQRSRPSLPGRQSPPADSRAAVPFSVSPVSRPGSALRRPPSPLGKTSSFGLGASTSFDSSLMHPEYVAAIATDWADVDCVDDDHDHGHDHDHDHDHDHNHDHDESDHDDGDDSETESEMDDDGRQVGSLYFRPGGGTRTTRSKPPPPWRDQSRPTIEGPRVHGPSDAAVQGAVHPSRSLPTTPDRAIAAKVAPWVQGSSGPGDAPWGRSQSPLQREAHSLPTRSYLPMPPHLSAPPHPPPFPPSYSLTQLQPAASSSAAETPASADNGSQGTPPRPSPIDSTLPGTPTGPAPLVHRRSRSFDVLIHRRL